MHIRAEVSVFVLSHPGLLAPLATFLSEPENPEQPTAKRLKQKLQDFLQHALKRAFGTLPMEQLKRTLEQLPDHYKAQTGPQAPLLVGALATLTERYLQWGREQVELRPEHLAELQLHLERILPDQLSLFALRLHSLPEDPPDGSPRALSPKSLHRHFERDPLLPPPGLHFLQQLQERGLVEIHRHDALTRLPILRWAELMQNPARLENSLRHIARSQKGDWLDKPWVDDITHRRLMRLVRWAAQLRALFSRYWSDAGLTVEPLLETGGMSYDLIGEMEARLRQHGATLSGLDGLASELLPTPVGSPPFMDGASDPASLLPGGEPRPLFCERAFLCEALRRLCASELSQRHEALLHAYFLIQNLAVQFWIQSRRSEEGLDRFVQDYADSPLQDLESRERHDQLIQAWRTGAVRWLELRLAPNADAPDKLRQKMEDLLKGARGIRPRGSKPPTLLDELNSPSKILVQDLRRPSTDPEVSRPGLGFILHFIKKEDKDASPGQPPLLALPCRHHKRRLELEREREQVATLLENPTLAPYIVGLDVASLETRAPVEVFAPTLLALRQPFPLQEDDVEQYFSWGRQLELAPLRLTCHAGEAFAHLLSGMRTVDETLLFLEMRAGDRLGHALAMGLDPQLWLERVGERVWIRQGEHLDNIVWFHHRLEGLGPFGGLCRRLHREIQRLSRSIYGETLELDLLQRAWEWRAQDPLSLYFVGGDLGSMTGSTEPNAFTPPASQRLEVVQCESLLSRRYMTIMRRRLSKAREKLGEDALKLWRRYHWDASVRQKYEEQVEADAGLEWVDAMSAVQDMQIQYCRTHGIVVEINPSSNLCIGPLRTLSQHPVFRWRGPGMDPEAGCQVVVGSDDPSVFGSELLHEYGFLWAAARERGHSLMEAERWLESLRRAGLRYSFLPYTLSGAQD